DLILGFGQTTRQDIHRAGGGCHSVYSRSLPPMKRLSLKNQVELDLERRLYTGGGTRHFVVNATKVAQELRDEYNVAEERISVIHTPVDLERFRPGQESKPALRGQLHPNRDPERPAFLFVSLNHRRKGLDALLEIWPEIDADLWIAGAPSNGHYLNQIRELEIEDQVVWLGKRDDLPDFYRAADAFVHPTLYDACANTVLQAMASELPTIVSANDGAKDFIEHEETGLLLQDPTDPRELHGHVSRILAFSADDRNELGKRARNRVSSQTWPNHLAAWNNIFELMLKEG
ncbi:MAG: glycosyltransferase family 4 protein, partial [Verrucomicrobiota bacterium]